MRHPKKQGKRAGKGGKPAEERAPQGPVERAHELLARLESGGPNPVNAAEELDRLQAGLGRHGELDSFREQVREFCAAWADTPLRGDQGHAWLVLVGGYGLKEQAPRAAALATDPGLPTPLRMRACRVLSSFGGEEAVDALQAVLLSSADPQLRATAAESLTDLGDASVRPVLEALLEEDLPRPVWTAVTAALNRL